MTFFTDVGSSFPFSKLWIITPNFLEIILYYGLIVYFTIRKGRWRFKLIVIIMIIVVFINNFCFIIFKPFTVSFIDVGQGDSCLIQTSSNKVVLIDGGGLENYDIGENVLLPYLLNKRIWKIDYIIISHFDFDHVGGLLTVLNEIRVDNVIISKQVEESSNLKKFKEIVKDKQIKVWVVGKGDRVRIDNEIYFDILWPNNTHLVIILLFVN